MNTERDNQLRRLLVATADINPTSRPRLTRRLGIGALGAFIVAAAFGGGALTAAYAGPPTTSDEHALRAGTEGQLGKYGKVLGPSYYFRGSASTDLHIDRAPKGADLLRVELICKAAKRAELKLDGVMQQSGDCGGSGVTLLKTATDDAHTLTVMPTGHSDYVLFAVWIKSGNVEPSAQTEAEIADGRITRQEYEYAFSRYLGCIAEAGYPEPERDLSAVVLGPSGDAQDAAKIAAADHCESREWLEVDKIWQLQSPQ